MHEKFLLPGRDGELAPGVNLWRKGIVYTKRPDLPVGPGYRVSAAFKGRPTQTDEGFHRLYQRVAFVANQRVFELTTADRSLAAGIVCQGWRLLGHAGNIATTFIMMALRSLGEIGNDIEWEQPPTDQDLRAPGGASIEDLTRLAPQWRAGELYSEFDFTDLCPSSLDLVTVSYGETVPEIPVRDCVDFRPFVERAESFAATYHQMLTELREVEMPFRMVHREWFLADRKLVTVHVCFDR
jgi:hypothetical protein